MELKTVLDGFAIAVLSIIVLGGMWDLWKNRKV